MPRFILFVLCIAFLAAAGGLVTIGMALGLVVCFALGVWVTLLVARMFSSFAMTATVSRDGQKNKADVCRPLLLERRKRAAFKPCARGSTG